MRNLKEFWGEFIDLPGMVHVLGATALLGASYALFEILLPAAMEFFYFTKHMVSIAAYGELQEQSEKMAAISSGTYTQPGFLTMVKTTVVLLIITGIFIFIGKWDFAKARGIESQVRKYCGDTDYSINCMGEAVVGDQESKERNTAMTFTEIQRALAALREIQVKAVELPPSCEHDAHVIAALAVTVEQILSREIQDAA